MTVAELIEKLSKLPPDMVVATDGGLDNDVTADLTLYRIHGTVERKSNGSAYVSQRISNSLLRDEVVEDWVLLAHWGQGDDAVEL